MFSVKKLMFLLVLLLVTLVPMVATPSAHAQDGGVAQGGKEGAEELGVTCPRETWRLDHLTSNAWQYNQYFDPKVRINILSADRGFRVITYRTDYYGRQWACGYSAQFPGEEGWILRSHLIY